MSTQSDNTQQPDAQPADTASAPNVGCVPDAAKTLNIDASLASPESGPPSTDTQPAGASSAGVSSAVPATPGSPLEQAIDRGDMAAAIEALAPSVELLPYQLDAVAAEDRFTWSCWSRQVGKSFTFSLRRLLRGLIRRRNQIILSAGERQSREVMEKVRMHCRALRIWHEVRGLPFYRDATIKQLEARLPGGVRIIALPANPMTARGYTGDIFLDEFAMHRDDAAIWASLFPSLLRGSGELDIASTPMGRKNMFYKLQSNEKLRRKTVTLSDAVAAGLQVDVDTLREGVQDELIWRQEFCCEFADEATSFLTYDVIRACCDPSLGAEIDGRRIERRDAEIYMGVDVGRFRDLTVIWLWERRGGVFITRGVRILQAAPFAEQEEEIARMLDCRGVRRCCIDATGLGLQLAERLVERFGDHRVEQITFSAAIKSELAGAVRVLAERRSLRIPADEAIVRDWHSIERIVTNAGNVRFDADRSSGGHADRFWAAALGIHAASDPSGDAELITSQKLRFARRGIW